MFINNNSLTCPEFRGASELLEINPLPTVLQYWLPSGYSMQFNFQIFIPVKQLWRQTHPMFDHQYLTPEYMNVLQL